MFHAVIESNRLSKQFPLTMLSCAVIFAHQPVAANEQTPTATTHISESNKIHPHADGTLSSTHQDCFKNVSTTLSPSSMFDLAQSQESEGNARCADVIYRILMENPNEELKIEAMFRLASIYVAEQVRLVDAALLYADILKMRPKAQRVRIELARVNALMGRLGSAERQLRAAYASGDLPPQLERAIRLYATGVGLKRKWTAVAELSLAPDSNVNRASRAEQIETVLGDFVVSEDGRETSGFGIAARGAIQNRAQLNDRVAMVSLVSANLRQFRGSRFSDYSIAFSTGPEFRVKNALWSLRVGASERWFGGQHFLSGIQIEASHARNLTPTSVLRFDIEAAITDNRFNNLQDSTRILASAGFEKSITDRFGFGVQGRFGRTVAKDPGWSDFNGGASAYLFYETPRLNVSVDGSLLVLASDQKLNIFPSKRKDQFITLGGSVTFRSVQFRGFSPVVRLRQDFNRSSVGLFIFKRTSAELGVARSF